MKKAKSHSPGTSTNTASDLPGNAAMITKKQAAALNKPKKKKKVSSIEDLRKIRKAKYGV